MVVFVWFILMVAFFVIEGLTTFLVSIWFAAGSLVAMIIAIIFPKAVSVQIIAFVVVSIVCVFALRPLTRRLIGGKKIATNVDASIGKKCQVIQEIQPDRFGRVKLNGLEWMAASDHFMPVGSWGTVVAIDGVKLVVVPFENE